MQINIYWLSCEYDVSVCEEFIFYRVKNFDPELSDYSFFSPILILFSLPSEDNQEESRPSRRGEWKKRQMINSNAVYSVWVFNFLISFRSASPIQRANGASKFILWLLSECARRIHN